MSENATMEHRLSLEDRNRIDVTGVTDVDSFDDTTVSLTTSRGELTIRGQGLQVNRLNVENGLLSVDGKIDSLSYSEPVRGFWGRLLK